ncbi:hypothetical protein GGR57DRAFT_486823 [Xylariaceae sp. FL1272]|nr:hypothetical protein GGR57DRAFT_486823 [Xylariaceae sp. FL1272]
MPLSTSQSAEEERSHGSRRHGREHTHELHSHSTGHGTSRSRRHRHHKHHRSEERSSSRRASPPPEKSSSKKREGKSKLAKLAGGLARLVLGGRGPSPTTEVRYSQRHGYHLSRPAPGAHSDDHHSSRRHRRHRYRSPSTPLTSMLVSPSLPSPTAVVQPRTAIPEVRYSEQHGQDLSRRKRGDRHHSHRSSRHHRRNDRLSRPRSPSSSRSPSPSGHRHHYDLHHQQQSPLVVVQTPTAPPASAPAPLVYPPADIDGNAVVQSSAATVVSPPAIVQSQRSSRGETGRNSIGARSVSRLTVSAAPSAATSVIDSSFDAPGLNLTRTNLAHIAEADDRPWKAKSPV